MIGKQKSIAVKAISLMLGVLLFAMAMFESQTFESKAKACYFPPGCSLWVTTYWCQSGCSHTEFGCMHVVGSCDGTWEYRESEMCDDFFCSGLPD